jgi:uncharacterized membrane protein
LKFSSRDVAFVAIFTAFSVIVIRLLPGIPIVGVSDARITFDAALAPIYGMIIGPYLGFASALFGGLITAGSVFNIFTSFSPAVSALIAGFLTQKEVFGRSRVRGWMVAALVLGLLILGWYATDIGRQAPFYPVLHLAGLVLIIGSRGWTAKIFRQGQTDGESRRAKTAYFLGGITLMIVAFIFTNPYVADVSILSYFPLPMFLIGGIIIVYSLFGAGKSSFVLAVSLASYCGIIADHMLGNLAFINSINLFVPLSEIPSIPALFMSLIPVSTVERLLLTVIGTTLGVGLILALRRTNLFPRKLED